MMPRLIFARVTVEAMMMKDAEVIMRRAADAMMTKAAEVMMQATTTFVYHVISEPDEEKCLSVLNTINAVEEWIATYDLTGINQAPSNDDNSTSEDWFLTDFDLNVLKML